MHLDLSGKVVLVTGAARGIGRAIAETFGGEGATVVAIDVEPGGTAAVAAAIEEAGGRCLQQICDVSRSADTRRMVDEVVAELGRIDVLVNNAGVHVEGMLEELTDEAWDRCFAVNVRGVFSTCKAVAPVMKAQRSGRILNAASFAAIVPSVGSAAYAASKAAVVQLSRTLAGELGPWGITVNSYAPGMVPTAMNGFAQRPAAEQEELLDTLTLRRWGAAEDVADLLRFLASDAASYITGTLLDVSGGKLATQLPRRAHERMWAESSPSPGADLAREEN